MERVCKICDKGTFVKFSVTLWEGCAKYVTKGLLLNLV